MLLEGDPFHNHLAPLDLGKLHPVFDLQALALALERERLKLREDLVPVVRQLLGKAAGLHSQSGETLDQSA